MDRESGGGEVLTRSLLPGDRRGGSSFYPLAVTRRRLQMPLQTNSDAIFLPVSDLESSNLVLSLFTGAGLLDRGFESEGYCVVSAGDIIFGRDIREFHPARGVFAGVIGGSPCQDFSKARRAPPTGNGLAMLSEFARCVTEAAPAWFLLENVPQVPHIKIPGYTVQRLNLNAKECGVPQNRLRCFQFGSRDGAGIVIYRGVTLRAVSRCCMASDGKRAGRRTWADFCALQGLPRGFDLPGLSQALKYRLVGNGVPVPMARVIATAIRARHDTLGQPVCRCGCGRPVKGRQTLATPACRKRQQRKRDAAGVPQPGPVTPALSLV